MFTASLCRSFLRAPLLAAVALVAVSGAAVQADETGFTLKNGQLRAGYLTHGIASDESGTQDLNAEWLLPAFDFGQMGGFSLHPQVGGDFNLQGRTNAAYAGFAGIYQFSNGIFVEGDLGGSVNDGYKTAPANSGRSELGCNELFREAFVVGVPLTSRLSVMAVAEHMSNANLCQPNNGITNVGMKLGFSF